MKKRRWSSSWSFFSFLVLLCCHGNFTENIPKTVTQHAKDVHIPPAESKSHVVSKDEESSSSQPEASGKLGEDSITSDVTPDLETNRLEVLNDNVEIESSSSQQVASSEKPDPLPQENDDVPLSSSVNPRNADIKDSAPTVLGRLTTRQCAPLSSPASTTEDDVAVPTASVESEHLPSPAESIEDKLSAKFASVLHRSTKGTDDAAGSADAGEATLSVSTDGELGKAAESERPAAEGGAPPSVGDGGGAAAAAGMTTSEGSGHSVPATEDMPSFNEWAAKKRLEEQVKNGLNLPSVASQQVKVTTKQKMRHKNYASLDCGAKVLTANSEAQSTSAVLSQNRDDYMLNPCTAKIWLVIELCESIQADRIELANYELFSSTPREFSVFSSDRYPSREWTLLGKFEARDERTVQSFNLEHSQFGKFIKVELVSHYGSEHFCLLSLVRVYGTSEYEALDTDDAEASGGGPASIEEEDDELGSDSGQESQNLFGSAKDAVMNIVKKYTEALRSEKNGVAASDSVPILQVGSDGGRVSSKQPDNCFCMQRVSGGGCETSDTGVVADGRRSSLTKTFLLCHYPELLDVLQRNGDLHLGMCGSVCHILTEDEDDARSVAGHRTHRSSCGFHLAVFGPVKFGALCRLHALLLEEQRGTPPADRPRCNFGNVTIKPPLLTMDQAGSTLKTSVLQADESSSTSTVLSSVDTYDVMCADLGICTTSSSTSGGIDHTASAVPSVPVSSASIIVNTGSSVGDQRTLIHPTKTISGDAQVPCRDKDVDGHCRSAGVGGGGGRSHEAKTMVSPLDHTAGQWPSDVDPPSVRVPSVMDNSPKYPPGAAESSVVPVSLESSISGGRQLPDSSILPPASPSQDDVSSNVEGSFLVLGSPSTSAVEQSSSTLGGAVFSATAEFVAQREMSHHSIGTAEEVGFDEDLPVLTDCGARDGFLPEAEVVPTAASDSLRSTVASAVPLQQQHDYGSAGNGGAGLMDVVGGVERQPNTAGLGVPVLSATGMAPGQKESVFVRLSNRIKALELNMSLSSQYLEELSRRYRKQMEEMQRAFNKTIGALNESARLTHERDINQQKVIDLLQAQLANITVVVEDLQERQESHLSNVIIQIVAQGLILVVLFLACSRPGHQQAYRDRHRMGTVVTPPRSLSKSRNPSPTDSRGKTVAASAVRKRRNSDTSVVKHKRPSSVKAEAASLRLIKDSRRPSSEALNVSGTYSDLLIIEPTWMDKSVVHREIDQPKKKKKNKGKAQLGRSNSNRSSNSVDAQRVHSKASRKTSLASESSAGLLFGACEGCGPLRVQDLPPPSGAPARRSMDAGLSSGWSRRSAASALSLLPPSSVNGHYYGQHSPPLNPGTNGHDRTNGISGINGCMPDLNPVASFRAPGQQNHLMTNGVRKGSVQKVYG